jgi:hypothetical protein
MKNLPEALPAVDDFLAQLDTVPWFSNIGRPTPADAEVGRIHEWEEWPGPEEPTITELSLRHQALFDDIMADAGAQRAALTEVWDRVHDRVFRAAAPKVPYDPQRDAWHGPTTAVWQAAWTAGLVGLCLHTGRSVPPEIQEQWLWFVRGHWPSGYSSVRGKLGALLVY